ncbi:MFS transporter, NNP family, nitrate/nitrite transporter [Bacteroides sp. HPS0048]|uniref:MFS transporter n=1 Tax=Bacteroides sp. HPS0048 TaxID=1078089 RepID=UPI000377859B|nr:MFS transporter [Bacteroides sp. HPS0048]EOA56165.1 MFS transporter, NNP family, nitrate/nitrite transporter [Bacteroides sp. HPS0048]
MNAIKIKGSPARGLAAATLGFFFGSAAISLFGPSATKLNEVMELSPSMLGLLVAIPTLSGSLLRIPFGASVDENGGRKSFLWLMVLSVIGLAGLSLLLTTHYPDNMEGTYWLILLFGCLSGCGVATFSVGAGQTSYWYPKNKQGFALGIFGGFGTLGAGVFALILPVLLQSVGFVSAYHIWTAFMILGTILYAVISCNAYFFQYRTKGFSEDESKKMATEAGQELFPAGNMKQSLIISAKIPETWILVIAYFVTFGGFMALTAWLPTYWQKTHGLSATQAGLYTAVYACLAALLRIPGGSISDRIGGLKVSMFAIALLGSVSIIMAFSSNWILSGICTLVIAVAFGLNNAAIMKLAPVYVSKSVGGASGWVGGLGAFGGFVIPPVLGKVVDVMGITGYYRGFFTFTVLSIIVLLILYFGLVVRNKNKK